MNNVSTINKISDTGRGLAFGAALVAPQPTPAAPQPRLPR